MVQAIYFDGRQAGARPVSVAIGDARVVIAGADVSRDEPLGAVTLSTRVGSAPMFLYFGDGATCEITDLPALDAMLAAVGLGQDRLSAWERHRGLAAVAAAALLVGLVVSYQIVLPLLARIGADRVPLAGLNVVSTQALAALDATVFEPSTLSPARQHQITQQFSRMTWPGGSDLPMTVVFRASPTLGANALALPSGLIVMTDELEALALNDFELMGVLAHEAGHVQARHGMRSVIQSSVMSILVTWYVGDVSGLAAAAPTALLEAKYSRDLEDEADFFAAETLYLNDTPIGFLVDILRRLDSEHGGRSNSPAAAYLSSHPTTPERLERLQLFAGE